MECNVKSVFGISFLLVYLTCTNSELVAQLNDSIDDEDVVCDCVKLIESEDGDTAEPLYCPGYLNTNPVRKAR